MVIDYTIGRRCRYVDLRDGFHDGSEWAMNIPIYVGMRATAYADLREIRGRESATIPFGMFKKEGHDYFCVWPYPMNNIRKPGDIVTVMSLNEIMTVAEKNPKMNIGRLCRSILEAVLLYSF